MTEVVITGAARTPIGAFNGAFATVPAHTLGEVAVREAMARAKIGAGEVDEVILGQILTAGEGQNPARQAAVAAGVPYEKTAFGINQLCGSGLRAVALGFQAVRNGVRRAHVLDGRIPHVLLLELFTDEGIGTMVRSPDDTPHPTSRPILPNVPGSEPAARSDQEAR
jgi:acetyl-CoA C-acetyltransferase